MKPTEFWELTPTEFWWIHEAKKPVKLYGDLTEHDVDSLKAAIDAYHAPEAKGRRNRINGIIAKVKKGKFKA